MLKIVENYKHLFSLCVKSQFVVENNQTYDDVPEIKEDTAADLIDRIKADGKIDGKDLATLNKLEQKLSSEKENVFKQTKEKLKEAYSETLSKGFEVNNKESYDVLTLLLSKINTDLKLPDYNSFFKEKAHVISYENGKLKVYNKASGMGTNNSRIGYIDGGKFVKDSSGFDVNYVSNDNGIDIDMKPIKSEVSSNQAKQEPLKESIKESDKDIEQKELLQEVLGLLNTEKPDFKKIRSKLDNLIKISGEFSEENKQILSQLEKILVAKEGREKNEKTFKEAKSFYKSVGATPENIGKIQNALLEKGEKLPKFGADKSFGVESYTAIVSFQKKNGLQEDGKVGTETLKKLGLIKANETSKDFYKKVKISTGKIDNGSIKEDVLVEDETSTLDAVMDKLDATYEQIMAWLDEFFTGNTDLTSFVGANGEKIDVEYNPETKKLSIDTGFGDGISDYDLTTDDVSNLKDIEDVKKYAKGVVETLKKEYDNKILEAKFGKENLKNAKYENGESVLIEGDKVTIDDLGKNTVIEGVPEGKLEDLIKFYKVSSLSKIDFSKSLNYEDLKAENSFMAIEESSEEQIYSNLKGNKKLTVTGNEDLTSFNIDAGAGDIRGLNVENVDDPKNLYKIVAWYNASIKSSFDFPGNTIDYKDIKDEIFEL